MIYLLLKLVHVAAVVLFLGNTTLGLFWVRHARRLDAPARIAETLDGVIRSDRLFTLPCVLILAVAGIGAALYGGLPLLRTPWIAAGLALFALSGFSYRWVGQLQQRILGEARRPDATLAQLDPLLQRWSRIASFSVGLAWIALIVMVLKIPR